MFYVTQCVMYEVSDEPNLDDQLEISRRFTGKNHHLLVQLAKLCVKVLVDLNHTQQTTHSHHTNNTSARKSTGK